MAFLCHLHPLDCHAAGAGEIAPDLVVIDQEGPSRPGGLGAVVVAAHDHIIDLGGYGRSIQGSSVPA